MWRVKFPVMTDPRGMQPQRVSDGFWPAFGSGRPRIEQNRRVILASCTPTPARAGTWVETGKPAGGRACRIAQLLLEPRVASKLYNGPCKYLYGTNTVLIGAQRLMTISHYAHRDKGGRAKGPI